MLQEMLDSNVVCPSSSPWASLVVLVKKKDASSPDGHFEFNVILFGLCNAPATFQRLIDIVLAGVQWSQVNKKPSQ